MMNQVSLGGFEELKNANSIKIPLTFHFRYTTYVHAIHELSVQCYVMIIFLIYAISEEIKPAP